MHKFGLSTPHTTHCAPNGEIMISTMGTPDGDALGDFLCIDTETLEAKGSWTRGERKAKFGYDFWYQPYHDTLVASEWGVPRVFKKGFTTQDSIGELNYYFCKYVIYYKVIYKLQITMEAA